MIHPIDYRYGSVRMRSIFDEGKKLEQMLLVERVLADSLAELGAIPEDAAAEINEGAKRVTLERVRQIEEETHHDVMAVVKALTEQCGDSGKYVHLTATSYDIQDTAQALQLRDALAIILEKGNGLLRSCVELSKKHRGLVMIGRTHGQHAIPITLGFKFANYSDKVGEDLLRLQEDAGKYVCGKFSGAVGTYSAQQTYGIDTKLEKLVMDKLGIASAGISTQVVARENIARIISDIAILAGTCEQIAKEVRNLQRTEIGELSEPFSGKQVGSSTMAQKRNPVDCENVCSNARVIRSCVQPALENIALEHERDLTNSAAERSILPTVFVLAEDVITRLTSVLDGLAVHPDSMGRNLESTNGTIMSEAAITALVKKGLGRQEAHEILRVASRLAVGQNRHLRDVLEKDYLIGKHLTAEELSDIFDYSRYIGRAREKTDEMTRKWEDGLRSGRR